MKPGQPEPLCILVMLACSAPLHAASAQTVGTLPHTFEQMPWEESISLVECGGTLYHSTYDGAVFLSHDGATWSEGPTPELISILIPHCIDDQLWGLGIPAVIARRRPNGEWIVEHWIESNPGESRNPPDHINELLRMPSTGALRAWGWGNFEHLALERNADGTWRRILPYEPPPPAVRSPRAECRRRPLRSRLRPTDVVVKAIVCSGARLLLYTDDRADRPAAIVRIPRSLRSRRLSVRSVVDGSVFLTRPSRWDPITDEPSHWTIVRYRQDRWNATELEQEYGLIGGEPERNGMVLFTAYGGLYRFPIRDAEIHTGE